MRSMFHCQARLTGSNAISPSSASAVKNWIAKNGFPPVFSCEGRKGDLLHYRSGFANPLELEHQRMGGVDFVVSVGTDQHQVLHIRPGQHILEQIERCRVE